MLGQETFGRVLTTEANTAGPLFGVRVSTDRLTLVITTQTSTSRLYSRTTQITTSKYR